MRKITFDEHYNVFTDGVIQSACLRNLIAMARKGFDNALPPADIFCFGFFGAFVCFVLKNLDMNLTYDVTLPVGYSLESTR